MNDKQQKALNAYFDRKLKKLALEKEEAKYSGFSDGLVLI